MKRGLAVAVMLFATRTGSAQPCPPRADLGGDSAAIAQVANELRRLGVTISDTAPEPGCAVVHAQVQLDDNGGIAVAVRGASRGSEGRVVSDAALAAAWIDSWTRDDDALLGVPPALAAPSSRVATAEPMPVQDPAPQDAAATTSMLDRIALAISYEETWTNDDTSWSGIVGAACIRVGAFCLGGRARYASQPERLYKSTALTRRDLAVSGTASYPLSVGTMSVEPEVGLGIGSMTTKRVDGDCKEMPPPNCDPMDPTCQMQPGMCVPTDPNTTTPPKLFVGDHFNTSTLTARLSLAVRIAVPLFQHVWLDGFAGYTLAPFAHTSEFAGAGTMNLPDVAIPGEPSSGYALGVGLRVGSAGGKR